MLDCVAHSLPNCIPAIAAALALFLAGGCQGLPNSSPVTAPSLTARGAQPAIETADEDETLQSAEPPTIGPKTEVAAPFATSSEASSIDSEFDSWLSETGADSGAASKSANAFRPGSAAGISSLIPPPAEGNLPDGSVEDPTRAMGRNGVFGPTADDDDPPFNFVEPVAVEPVEPRICFKDDIVGVPVMFWNDARSIVTWPNAIVLGAAAGAALVIRDDLDQKVRYETAEHPLRWGQGSVTLRQFGEYSYQVPVLTGVYALSLWAECDQLHEFSLAAFSAYGLTAISTVAIKGMTNTTRPTTQFENGQYGFPSYHAASTFTLAAVVEEYYGWQWGLPAYALAGLVGWSRIDQREHDLSDVFFGSVLGLVIGKTVAAAHLNRRADMKITPYYDAQNHAAAVAIEKRF